MLQQETLGCMPEGIVTARCRELSTADALKTGEKSLKKTLLEALLSVLQMYNEEVNDLLAPENKRLAVKESREDGVYVAGAVPPARSALIPRHGRRGTVLIRSGAPPQKQAEVVSLMLHFLQAVLLPPGGRSDSFR